MPSSPFTYRAPKEVYSLSFVREDGSTYSFSVPDDLTYTIHHTPDGDYILVDEQGREYRPVADSRKQL